LLERKEEKLKGTCNVPVKTKELVGILKKR